VTTSGTAFAAVTGLNSGTMMSTAAPAVMQAGFSLATKNTRTHKKVFSVLVTFRVSRGDSSLVAALARLCVGRLDS